MLPTRPTNHAPPQTLRSAKADFQRFGPRLTSQDARRLERGGELFRRAEKIKEAETRRKTNAKKKLEREEKERTERRKMGIPSPLKHGLASRKMGIGEVGSQKTLAGIGFFKSSVGKKKEEPEEKNVKVKPEPWEGDEELDDVELMCLDTMVKSEEVRPTSVAAQQDCLELMKDKKLPNSLASPAAQRRIKEEPSSKEETKAVASSSFGKRIALPKPSKSEEIDFALDFLDSNTQIAREISCMTPQIASSKSFSPSGHVRSPSHAVRRQHTTPPKPQPVRIAPSTMKSDAVQSARDRVLMPPPSFKRPPFSSRPAQRSQHCIPAKPSISSNQSVRTPLAASKRWTVGGGTPARVTANTLIRTPLTPAQGNTGNQAGRARTTSVTPIKKEQTASIGAVKHDKAIARRFGKENDPPPPPPPPPLLLQDEDFVLSTQDCREIFG